MVTAGFEPAQLSPSELESDPLNRSGKPPRRTSDGTRTRDRRIKSAKLCLLSITEAACADTLAASHQVLYAASSGRRRLVAFDAPQTCARVSRSRPPRRYRAQGRLEPRGIPWAQGRGYKGTRGGGGGRGAAERRGGACRVSTGGRAARSLATVVSTTCRGTGLSSEGGLARPAHHRDSPAVGAHDLGGGRSGHAFHATTVGPQ